MPVIGYADMYSGAENPQRQLTDQEASRVEELISQLTVPYTGLIHINLGFSGFSVSDGENWVVVAHSTCWCSVWQNQELKHYEDTVGLLAFLEEILTPMMDQHLQEESRVMAAYYEEMFGISQQKKI
jgi:hypothetical protein